MSNTAKALASILGIVNPAIGVLLAVQEGVGLITTAQNEGRDLTDDEVAVITGSRKIAIDAMNAVD